MHSHKRYQKVRKKAVHTNKTVRVAKTLHKKSMSFGAINNSNGVKSIKNNHIYILLGAGVLFLCLLIFVVTTTFKVNRILKEVEAQRDMPINVVTASGTRAIPLSYILDQFIRLNSKEHQAIKDELDGVLNITTQKQE